MVACQDRDTGVRATSLIVAVSHLPARCRQPVLDHPTHTGIRRPCQAGALSHVHDTWSGAVLRVCLTELDEGPKRRALVRISAPGDAEIGEGASGCQMEVARLREPVDGIQLCP